MVGLDDEQNEELLDRKLLGEYVRNKITDERTYYIVIGWNSASRRIWKTTERFEPH